jgi:hypothetical protein
VWYSHKEHIRTVDATVTISALHQSRHGVASDHGSLKIPDPLYNLKLMGVWDPHRHGRLGCVEFRTSLDSNENIKLIKKDFDTLKHCPELRKETTIAKVPLNEVKLFTGN